MAVDPKIFQLTAAGRQAAGAGELHRRIRVLERGGGSGVVSGAIGTGTVSDATTLIKGKVQLGGHIAAGTAAAPLIQTTSSEPIRLTGQPVTENLPYVVTGRLLWTSTGAGNRYRNSCTITSFSGGVTDRGLGGGAAEDVLTASNVNLSGTSTWFFAHKAQASSWNTRGTYYGYDSTVVHNPVLASTAITSMANNGSGLYRVTSTAHGLSNGMSCTVSGVTGGGATANGSWVISGATANTIDLVGSTFVATGTGTLQGEVYKETNNFSSYNEVACKGTYVIGYESNINIAPGAVGRTKAFSLTIDEDNLYSAYDTAGAAAALLPSTGNYPGLGSVGIDLHAQGVGEVGTGIVFNCGNGLGSAGAFKRAIVVKDNNAVERFTVTGGGLVGIGPYANHNHTDTLTAGLTLSTSAMTDKLVQDSAHGDNQAYFGQAAAGQRWDIRHGTSAAPVGVEGPTMKVSRTEQFTSVTNGQRVADYCAFQAINVAKTGSKAQAVGMVGMGISYSTVTPKDLVTANTDCVGVVGIGVQKTGNTTGKALGGFFEGYAEQWPSISGVEIVMRNNSGTDGTYTSGSGSTQTNGLFLFNVGSNTTGTGIIFANPNAMKFDVGIAVDAGNAIISKTFSDDGNAATSLYIGGSHSTAAIAIAAGSGSLLVGLTTTSLTTAAHFRSSSDAHAALDLQGFSATQSATLLRVRDGAGGTTKFSITDGGSIGVRTPAGTSAITLLTSTIATGGLDFGGDTNLYRVAADALQTDDAFYCQTLSVWSTTGAGFVQVAEQASPPGTAPTGTARLYAEASGATTVLKFKDDAGAIVTLGAAGAGAYISSHSDVGTGAGTPLDLDVTANNLTASIPTTAQPQLTSLGIAVAAPATGFGITNGATGQSSTAGLFVTAAGVMSINRSTSAAQVYLQCYSSTDGTNTATRFGVQSNTDGSVRLRFGDGSGTVNELYKVFGSNILKTSHAFEVTTTLTVTGSATHTGALTANGGGTHTAPAIGTSALDVRPFSASQTQPMLQVYDTSGAVAFSINPGGAFSINDRNMVLGTTTGTKFGTSTSQKQAWWNATPVIQPTAVADATGGAVQDAEARTALNGMLAKLRTIGIIAT